MKYTSLFINIYLFALLFFPRSSALAFKLENPLTINTLYDFIRALLDIVVEIGIPVAVFFIVLSGFMFVTARGNEQQITLAKKTFLWTVVGTAVILGAWILSEAIAGTIKQLKS